MLRSHRVIVVAVTLVLVAPACGGDGAEDASGSEDDAPSEEATADETDEDDDAPTTTSTTTSTVPDAEAEEPPGASAGELDGRDEPPVWVADLSGDEEVPDPGDQVAVGRTEIETGGENELCIDMVADGLDSEVTDAHIHEGSAGASGPPVIPIGRPTERDGERDTWTDICVEVDPALLDRMVADPSAFYANVHTETFPGGAIRGQLAASTIFDLTLS